MLYTMIDYKIQTPPKILLLFLFFAMLVARDASAQNNTRSPFSIFELGEIETRDFGSTAGMGNVGIGFQSENFLNRRNPAALKKIDTLRFIIDVTAAVKFSEFITATNMQRTNNFNFKTLAVGVRLNKIWTGSVGLKPFSNVGYHIRDQIYVEGTINSYENVSFSGSGGINNFYWANSFELFRGFSVGLTAAYLFGNITHNEDTEVISIINTNNISKIHFDFGMQYSHTFKEHTNITVGGIYIPNTNLDIQRTKIITSMTGIDRNQRLPDYRTHLPESYGAGFSITRNKKSAEWILAADYQLSKWSVKRSNNKAPMHFGLKDGEYNFYEVNSGGVSRDKPLAYSDSEIYSVGLQYTPNTRNPEKMIQITRFHLGARYNRSYLKVYGHQLEDYSISFGAGIPFTNQTRTLSYVNVAVTVGESGTGERGGITERYILISANLSLLDRWWPRQQIN